MTDTTTREFCARCHRISPVGFHARDDIWKAVAGRHWEHSILCILCFAALGDEKHIVWEEGIEFYPVSYATHHAGRGRHDATPLEVDRLRKALRDIQMPPSGTWRDLYGRARRIATEALDGVTT